MLYIDVLVAIVYVLKLSLTQTRLLEKLQDIDIQNY